MLSLAATDVARCVQVGHYTEDNENCIPLPDFTVHPGVEPSDAGQTDTETSGTCRYSSCNNDRGPTECQRRRRRYSPNDDKCYCKTNYYVSPTSGGDSCKEKSSVKWNREMVQLRLPEQVRKTPNWPRSWANFSLFESYSIHAGTHGPTCVFWANLTPLSL